MKSIINLNNINKSLSGLGKSVQGAIKRSENIAKNIKERNISKKESISMSNEFFAKRRDQQRRREKEELLEAGGVLGAFKASGRAIRRTTRGFLGRILDYIGTIIIGWAILNLPKIIKIAQDLIKRVREYFGILTKFVNGVATLFTDFGGKLTEFATTLLPFNFEGFADNIKVFMDKIRNAFEQVTLNTIKTIKVFTDKSERELAYEIGLGKMYDRMKNGDYGEDGEDDGQDDGQEDGDQQNNDQTDGEEKNELDKLILQGIEALKVRRGGELTQKDQKAIEGQEPLDIYRYLLEQDVGLYYNERDNILSFLPLETYKKLINDSPDVGDFFKPVPVSDNPFDMSEYEGSGFSEPTVMDNLRERYYDFEGDVTDRIDSIKDFFNFDDPNASKDNEIYVEIPIDNGQKSEFINGDVNLNTGNGHTYDVGNFKNTALQDINK